MTPYKSKSGKKSGVIAYAIAKDFIIVQFSHDARVYKYTYKSAGKTVIEEMKKRALRGEGLSTYIAQNDPGFE